LIVFWDSSFRRGLGSGLSAINTSIAEAFAVVLSARTESHTLRQNTDGCVRAFL
jgi:hypothetical protein